MNTELNAVTYGCEAVGYSDLNDFINPGTVKDRVNSQRQGCLWISLQGDLSGAASVGRTAEVAPSLASYIRERSIYGTPDLSDFDRNHYLALIGQGETVLVVLKFQRIIGQRILGRVPKAALNSAGVL